MAIGVECDLMSPPTLGLLDSWYEENLVCPRDHCELKSEGQSLVCATGHHYQMVDGVPVMLRDDVPQTIAVAQASLDRSHGFGADMRAPGLYLESLGISEQEKAGVARMAIAGASDVDPVVTYIIGATNGRMYRHLVGRLASYPIPDLRVPPGRGRRLLDVGCSWGRWSIAAARKGYEVIGIDPSLGAVMAARRVSASLGLSIKYVVADARYLPLRPASIDWVFSYSVFQHLSRDDVHLVAAEAGRILRAGGTGLVQMPTKFGVRCLYHQVHRRFREGQAFDVRYWTIPELQRTFGKAIGPTRVAVDCFFGIGLQSSDAPLMTRGGRAVLKASALLTRLSRVMSPLKYVADSVYITAVRS